MVKSYQFKQLIALMFLLVGIVLLSTVGYAQTYVNKTCLDNNTMQLNSTVIIDTGGNTTAINISKTMPCPFGCSDNECLGTNVANESTSVWLTYAAGVTFMCIGIFLGIPYGKLTGQENIRVGFDTVTVVRYIFFFVGLFIVYLSFGMARRMGTVYGMETNILGAVDTTTMVIMITILLFLFVFVVEFIFNIFKTYIQKGVTEKWGERTE